MEICHIKKKKVMLLVNSLDDESKLSQKVIIMRSKVIIMT